MTYVIGRFVLQSLVGAMRTQYLLLRAGEHVLLQSLVGAMRTAPLTVAIGCAGGVAIPRRGDEDSRSGRGRPGWAASCNPS
ncbi:hypothetical protein FrEUN1fDRAFT_5575 [Parafrankia sp. EUN1f]|nr:hypothetical protein FrEUN1fDRAFT_5575 [Parafrankia sp. EUN1f]